jgi:hypothetical protein
MSVAADVRDLRSYRNSSQYVHPDEPFQPTKMPLRETLSSLIPAMSQSSPVLYGIVTAVVLAIQKS